MAWIKRNLYFVITVAVGLGVTGFCGYLLSSALTQNKASSEQYLTDSNNYASLQKTVPYPDPQNIKAAQNDTNRVWAFLNEFHKPFASFPPAPTLDDQQFKKYLLESLTQLATAATNAGVKLPTPCTFSFSQQVNVLNYASNSIAPWVQELAEIKAILQILFNAKINYLEKIKRPVVTDEQVMGDDYLQVGTVSNAWSVKTPYEVTFRAFSPEIANVLAGIAASSNCFIVQTIHVSPSTEPLPIIADLQPPPAPPVMMPRNPYPQTAAPFNQFMGPNNSRDRFQEERRGMGMMPPMQPYFPPAYQVPPPAPAAPVAPTTILTETPLFVTLYIDVVKLNAPEKPVPVKPVVGARPSRRADR